MQAKLGFAGPTGHKDWRKARAKLKDAGCIEDFAGTLDGKTMAFVRLLKPYDPNEVCKDFLQLILYIMGCIPAPCSHV